MVEAERRLASLAQTVPVGAGRLQQSVSADNIGFDKGRRAGDGAIDMTLGRQMHHRIRLVQGKYTIQLDAIADIHLFEGVTLTARYLGQ